ncbi:hypothetical protein E0Z10_g2416 [Xylaria hypoxylon]|uniref:Uncharacterized protein n=1 Tax=Xylaria hypoxylon TaxID=37992 RepID=A0A4Z0Z628_9PEZI|nr:hypothetical protein E0Z10_g2416 [Xylaria hypoxylon]
MATHAQKQDAKNGPSVVAVHGNCVFSDAEYPVRITHHPGYAVLEPDRETGKVHLPLPTVTDPSMVGLLRVGAELLLLVHFEQYNSTSSYESRIVKAEVFSGCHLIWVVDPLNEKESFEVQLAKPDSPPPQTVIKAVETKGSGNESAGSSEVWDPTKRKAQRARYAATGLEVTLTIDFGRGALKLCSVELVGNPNTVEG